MVMLHIMLEQDMADIVVPQDVRTVRQAPSGKEKIFNWDDLFHILFLAD